MSEHITRERLEAALGKVHNGSACIKLFSRATEENRRELAPFVLAYFRMLMAGVMGRAHKAEFNLSWSGRVPDWDGLVACVLATATWEEIRKLADWGETDTRLGSDQTFEVLQARAPAWIDDWAEDLLQRHPERWSLVRRLVRAGTARCRESEVYLSAMLVGFEFMLTGERVPSLDREGRSTKIMQNVRATIRESLLADPELLEHEIWRLFQVQRGNSLNFAVHDESLGGRTVWAQQQKQKGWLETFVDFAQEGRLSRTRLLEESFAAIEREFPDAISRWFPRLFEALEPTVDERRAYLPRTWNMLRSKNGTTVTFALDDLQVLEDANALPDEEAVDQLGPILLDRTKRRAKQGLKLLERIAKRRPELAGRAVLAATQALSHEAAEIQAAAWKLVERHGSVNDSPLVAAVRDAMESVAPSVRSALEKWLRSVTFPAASGEAATVPAVAPTHVGDELAKLMSAARNAHDPFARAAGIPELLHAIEQGTLEFPEADLRSWEFPRLTSAPIARLETLDDLIDAAAAAIEGTDSPDDVERILDGISRLCDQRPDDFNQRTSALRQRTLVRLPGGRGAAIFLGDSLLCDLCGVIWAWLTGEVCSRTTTLHGRQVLQASTAGGETWIAYPPHEPAWLRIAFSCRALAIANRAARSDALPLLAAPTHVGGWIDPVVLVKRVRQLGDRIADVPPYEQALSLLRLAPDRRDEALQQLSDVVGEFADAFQHALGAESTIGPAAHLWAAAARARDPWSDDQRVEQRHPSLGPDMGRASHIHVECQPATDKPGTVLVRVEPPPCSLPPPQTWKFVSEQSYASADDIDPHPLRWLYAGLPRFWLCPDGLLYVRWSLTVWPASPAPLLAHGVQHLLANLEWTTMLWANRGYLERLIDPDIALTSVALLTIAVGLSAKEPGEAGLAIDAVIAGIEDGRLAGGRLGEMLQSLLSTGLVKPARWGKALGTVSKVSMLHANAVRMLLAKLFQRGTPPDVKALGSLLELFHELTTATNQPVDDVVRTWLGHISGSGKGAKTARALLAFQPATGQDRRPEIAVLALKARLSRVQRWAN